MTFLPGRTHGRPALHLLIFVLCALVFGVDLATERSGIEIWIFYLAPLALSLFVWRASTPIAVAALSTCLVAVTFLSEPLALHTFAREANRVFLIVTLWLTAVMSRQLIASKRALASQNWLRTGHNQLAACMQGDHSVEQLGRNVLGFFADYVGAPVAAFYLVEGNDALRRVATHALMPDAATERFHRGEGLVGQVAADGKPLRVRTPPGYLTVRSATGSAGPGEVLVVPARSNGTLHAVVELAFVDPADDLAGELVESVAEPIAIAVRSAMYRARLEELLEETRRQAEALQLQQEELRAANEELEEQRDRLQESEQVLQRQQADLEGANATLEQQSQVLAVQRDELVGAQSVLSAKAAELAQASRYKSEFLANMSHELRTPLNSSLILAKLLAENRDGNLTAQQVKFAETIHGAGNDLLALIDDILDLSKIEAGRIVVVAEPVAPVTIVDQLGTTFEPIAAERGLRWSAVVHPDAPAEIETDRQRLLQILKNLVSNACKFTDEGSVSLAVSSRGGRAVFTVTDTGIGIDPSQHEVIFEAFRQADGTTNRRHGGTGLGLSICRQLARLLGGEVELESAPGQGSTFRLHLPLVFAAASEAGLALEPTAATRQPPAADTANRPAPRPAVAGGDGRGAVRPELTWDDRDRADRGRTILVVEDDERFARILHHLAHEHGFDCLVATSVDDGLLLARQHAPSAIVLDIRLPDGSGLTVLERIKRDPATRHIPVHVISVADHTGQALAMGALGYVLKPASNEELVAAFRRIAAKLDQTHKRLLVVEDDPAQREAIVHLLAADNVEIVAAATAGEALAHLRESTFDCMVTDLHLPDAAGGEILEAVARDEACGFPPVIVYTGRALSADEEREMQRVSRSIIIKGARSPERLLDEVTLFLHQVESALPAERRRMLRDIRDREEVFDGKQILVVEDDVRNLFAVSSILEPKGARVEVARNGREALEVLERRPGVDLVLMDIMMPEMDGLQAMREIRERDGYHKMPIIALTAKAMPDDMQRCLAAGASDYMAKPIDVDRLLSLMRVWLSG